MFSTPNKLLLEAIAKIKAINNTEAKTSKEVEKIYIDIKNACVNALQLYLKDTFPKYKKKAKILISELASGGNHYEKIAKTLRIHYESLECKQYQSIFDDNTEKQGRFRTILITSTEKTFPLSGLHYDLRKSEKEEIERLSQTKIFRK